MQLKNAIQIFLLVISMGSMANAQLVPGPSHGGGGYPGGGGLVPGPSHGPGGGHGGGYPGPRPGNPYPGNPYPGNPYPGNPYPQPPPPPPPQPYPGNPGYGSTTRTIWVGRNVVNETLLLNDLSRGDLWGYEVVAVRANTRLTNVVRAAQLVADGRVVASQNNPGSYISLYPQYRLVLGNSVRTVGLSILGGAWVDSIEVELSYNGGGGYNPPPPPQPGYGQNIEINLYRSVFGSDRVDLTQYTDLSYYRGLQIQQVIITGSTRYSGVATISLLANGFNMGQVQFSGGYSQQGTLWLSRPLVIGNGADSLVLYTAGEMTIEHVTLVVR